VSYSLGYQFASMSLKRQGLDDIDAAKFASGLKTALGEDSSMLSDQEMQRVIQTYQMEAQRRATKKGQEEAQRHKEKGDKFLAAKKNRGGVPVIDSGLQ